MKSRRVDFGRIQGLSLNLDLDTEANRGFLQILEREISRGYACTTSTTEAGKAIEGSEVARRTEATMLSGRLPADGENSLVCWSREVGRGWRRRWKKGVETGKRRSARLLGEDSS